MEHDEGRRYVAGMDMAIAGAAAGDAAAIAAFRRHAVDFVLHLREHIEKEDHCLFPMAAEVLDPAEQGEMMEEFRRIEREAGGRRHEAQIAAARALCERFRLPFPSDDELKTIRSEFL